MSDHFCGGNPSLGGAFWSENPQPRHHHHGLGQASDYIGEEIGRLAHFIAIDYDVLAHKIASILAIKLTHR